MKYYREKGQFPKEEEKLLHFRGLYKKLKKKGAIQDSPNEPYIPSGDQDSAIKVLNDRRNDIIHFVPKIWFWDVSGSPTLLLQLMEIPQFLLSNCRHMVFSKELSVKQYQKVFHQIESSLNRLKEQYPTRRDMTTP